MVLCRTQLLLLFWLLGMVFASCRHDSFIFSFRVRLSNIRICVFCWCIIFSNKIMVHLLPHTSTLQVIELSVKMKTTLILG